MATTAPWLRWRGGVVAALLLAVISVTIAGTAVASSRRHPLVHGQQLAPPALAVITVDGKRAGPTFQGIGAISGGGGNSRFLIDYPPAQRRAILDLLFSPRRGAALQLLKLEIGGNGNSSDGSEPSVEQTRGNVVCDVGYEFWLARQALARNPAIKLYGLQWSAPGWVRAKNGTLWTAADITYVLHWLGCARRAGLRISYLGGWNEHYTPATPAIEHWYIALRRALDRHGYRSTTIVAADAYGTGKRSAYAIAADMEHNRALAQAIGVIGVHDVCGVESDGETCQRSPVALQFAATSHKLIWHSELGRTPAIGHSLLEEGPPGLARTLNSGYIDARITGTLLWPLVDSMPPGLPFSDRGLITADQPWGGYYRVNLLTWVVAQTTQFVQPGWHFVNGADGALPRGGSYVTYENPTHTAWSMVVQTSTARVVQRLRIDVRGGLPTTIHVWATPLLHGRALVEVAHAVRPSHGTLTVELGRGFVYTLTTTSGQSRGTPSPIPAPRQMPLPYYLSADQAGMARMLAPMEGSFQYVGRTLTQTTVGTPVPWRGCDSYFPYAVVGSMTWHNYAVESTVQLPPGSRRGPRPGAMIIAGFAGYQEPCEFDGYVLRIDVAGAWALVHNGDVPTLIAHGHVSASDRYALRLLVAGRTVTAWVGRLRVAVTTAPTLVRGLAGLGSPYFDAVKYRAFSVRSAA